MIVNAGEGYILTNHHVVNGADEIFVTFKEARRGGLNRIGLIENK